MSATNSVEMIDQLAGSIPENQLIQQVASGDKIAFRQLYLRYERLIFQYLLRLIHDHEQAEDLLQEVFLAVWKGAPGFRGKSKVKTWIYHIAHNQAVSWLRAHHPTIHLDEGLADISETHLQLESQVAASLQQDRIRQALDQLTPEHREVLELAYFHELSYREIADIAGCPVGTVKSRASFARRYLGSILNSSELNG